MNTRKKKIRVLRFSVIFTGLTNLLGYYLVKKGDLSKEEYNADLLRGTITQAASSLGIIYLQEQERQERKLIEKKHKEKKLDNQVDEMLSSRNKNNVRTIKELQEQD